MSLLNRTAVRDLILRECRRQRPDWDVTRVSGDALESVERKLVSIVHRAVQSHPSNGKTFDQVF